MWLSLLLLIPAAYARVTFPDSEVLDSKDLSGTKTTSFQCAAGCRVYSPSLIDDIVIIDGTGKELNSLGGLANVTTGEGYELPGSTAAYQLRNNGPANPSFVFYVVQKGAANYGARVQYLNDNSSIAVDAQYAYLLTILSTSGAVRFSDFVGAYSGALPSVYATGFDSYASCDPVYTASSASAVLNTAFSVPSPIATIDFKKIGAGRSVIVSGDYMSDSSAGADSSTVFVSPGYVGCESTKSSTYSLTPAFETINSTFSTPSDPYGYTLQVRGNFSMYYLTDYVVLTINGGVQKLSNSGSTSRTQSSTSFDVQFDTTNTRSADRFAFQFDMTSKAPVTTTTGSGHTLALITSWITTLVVLASW